MWDSDHRNTIPQVCTGSRSKTTLHTAPPCRSDGQEGACRSLAQWARDLHTGMRFDHYTDERGATHDVAIGGWFPVIPSVFQPSVRESVNRARGVVRNGRNARASNRT